MVWLSVGTLFELPVQSFMLVAVVGGHIYYRRPTIGPFMSPIIAQYLVMTCIPNR